jgi:hypothetical protein
MEENEIEDNFITKGKNNNQEESNQEKEKGTLEESQDTFGPDFGNFKVDEIIEEKETEPINDDGDLETIGKKEMNTILTNLNSYWIELMASLGLFLYLYIFEIIVILILFSVLNILKQDNLSIVGDSLSLIFKDIGMKYFIIIAVCQHLSVGFFCLTTFSSIFQETKHIKRFLILNSIKVFGFYILSIAILYGLVKVGIKDFVKKHIEKAMDENEEKFDEENRKKIIKMFDDLTKSAIVFFGNFLATYNVFYDKFVLGFLYIFLFTTPYDISGYKKVLFRMCSIFPIAMIVASLALRALMTRNELYINVFISPLFLGSKIVIYGFFVITLFAIKIKSIKYNVYEGEFISPKVFKKMASKIFSLLGFVELIIALAFPRWTNIGIGQKYLLILCAPIITLYDYKKKKKVKFPCCNKGDISLCFKIIVNIVGYTVAIVFGVVLIFEISVFIDKYIKDILNIIVNNLDLLLGILSNII